MSFLIGRIEIDGTRRFYGTVSLILLLIIIASTVAIAIYHNSLYNHESVSTGDCPEYIVNGHRVSYWAYLEWADSKFMGLWVAYLISSAVVFLFLIFFLSLFIAENLRELKRKKASMNKAKS